MTGSCPLLPQRRDAELGPPFLSESSDIIIIIIFFTYLFHFCVLTDRNSACTISTLISAKVFFFLIFKVYLKVVRAY